jgi:protein-disulfide isomerase
MRVHLIRELTERELPARKHAALCVFLLALTGLQLTAQTPARTPGTKTAPAAKSVDKAKIEAYVRHLFVWPALITVTVGDPTPAPMPGFYEVKVRGSQGEASQEETFYVSTDGQKMIRGTVFDLAKNPFKEDLDKLKTDYQASFGTPGAPVVVVEFSDFECPYCKQEAQAIRQNLLSAYPKEVRLYFMDFPLESLHPWAKSAAMAGRCIFHQNASAFWDYHDWIFSHQEEITPDNLKSKVLEFAGGKGLVADQLSTCIDTHATEDEVKKTRAIGHELDVDQTPTIFVNGRRMVGAVAWPDLKRVIDYEIEYQKTAKNAGEDCGCEVKLPSAGGSAQPSPKSGAPVPLHR